MFYNSLYLLNDFKNLNKLTGTLIKDNINTRKLDL